MRWYRRRCFLPAVMRVCDRHQSDGGRWMDRGLNFAGSTGEADRRRGAMTKLDLAIRGAFVVTASAIPRGCRRRRGTHRRGRRRHRGAARGSTPRGCWCFGRHRQPCAYRGLHLRCSVAMISWRPPPPLRRQYLHYAVRPATAWHELAPVRRDYVRQAEANAVDISVHLMSDPTPGF